jgi:DNA recombination protein RmuC
MALLVCFAGGMIFGMALGIGATLLVNWSREQLERRRTFDDFVGQLDQATESMRGLFTQEIGDRRQSFGRVSEQLEVAEKQTGELVRVTGALHQALSHPTIRGHWGERMVQDVLGPVGFEEGINYVTQKAMNGASGRPDYTFLLPRGLKVNLDAKFPLDNYLAHNRAEAKLEKDEYKKRFLADVRRRLKEVTSKEYVNPVENTVDFALLFIPNEQVYSFVNVSDPTLFDEALRSKVILCSPWTLYPVLSIIRLAIDNFILEKTTAAILPLMAGFEKQWTAFNDCLDKLGRRLADAQKEFDQLVSTRQRQLDRVLTQIQTLGRETDFHTSTEALSAP